MRGTTGSAGRAGMIALAIVCGAVGGAALLQGADAKQKSGAKKDVKDLSGQRKLLLQDKQPRLAVALPPLPKSSSVTPDRRGILPQKWVFRPIETARGRELAFWQEYLDRYEKLLADAGDPAKNVKLSAEDRARIEKNQIGIRTIMQELRAFFDGVRCVIEDPDDPTTAVYVKTVEINKTYQIASAVAQLKQRPLPWRLGRIAAEPTVLLDEKDTRYKNWEGWRVHVECAESGATKDLPSVPHYDLVHFYRRTVKTGTCYLVEVYARWKNAPPRDKKFAATVDYLLRGLKF